MTHTPSDNNYWLRTYKSLAFLFAVMINTLSYVHIFIYYTTWRGQGEHLSQTVWVRGSKSALRANALRLCFPSSILNPRRELYIFIRMNSSLDNGSQKSAKSVCLSVGLAIQANNLSESLSYVCTWRRRHPMSEWAAQTVWSALLLQTPIDLDAAQKTIKFI